MPGTQRKSPPKVQPSKVVPEAVTEPAPETVERFDFGEILAVGTEDPLPSKLFGVEFDLRRRFSGEEAARFFALASAKDYKELLELIAGEPGAKLWETVGSLNPSYASKVLNGIISKSGLYEGELLAPLPAFSQGMAGAQHTPDSSLTTG